ncbi:LysR family transcriptional regulator [Wenxinia marina]|nr:LysR family transcriptional regulator [Wenxinia marina]
MAPSEMQSANWDDFRFVLAVAEAGSVGSAARVLGVNHATVLRRIAAFETAHGTQLFLRTAQGYTVRPEQLAVIEALRETARAVDGVARTIRGRRSAGATRLRITSTDTFCGTVLPPLLARLRRETPGLSIDVATTNVVLDLGRMDADMTVRPALQLPADLVGAPAGRLRFAVYGAAEGGADAWLGLRGMLSRAPAAAELERLLDGETPECGADSFVTLRELIAAGQGRTYLPTILGDPDPRIVREDGPPEVSVPVWVALHGALSDSPRLVALRDTLAGWLRDALGASSGRSGRPPARA